MKLEARLNPKKDKDLIEAFSNIKDKSKEIRKLLRIALNNNSNLNFVFYDEPVRNEVSERIEEVDIDALKDNLMSNDFGF